VLVPRNGLAATWEEGKLEHLQEALAALQEIDY
jgi:hypothetical protein